MSRLIYLQKVARRLLEMTQVVDEEPGITGVGCHKWGLAGACSRHFSPCNRLFSPHFSSSPVSQSPAFSRLSISISPISGSGTAVLVSACRALDESSNCLFLLQKFEDDQENNSLDSLHHHEVMLHGLYQQQPLSDGIEIYPHSQ